MAKVGAEWRTKLAHLHHLSYSATTKHLVQGLRKLVRVNTNFSSVFRAVRGELPEAFWLRDAFGMITCTDHAFMSTSLNADVCKEYLSNKEGDTSVLWELKCGSETSEGFHSGADVSLLSQFPSEREMLFPPMTMLKVEMEGAQPQKADEVSSRGANYTRIVITPTFV